MHNPASAASGLDNAAVKLRQGESKRIGRAVEITMALAQFGLFLALLAPVTVSMAIKVKAIAPADAASTTATILAIGALFALVSNPVAGRLSDMTISRLGRRRPWMLGGAVLFGVAMLIIAQAGSIGMVLVGWCLAQVAGNAILSPLLATIADQVPRQQRASIAANVGTMQNMGILAAAYVASWFDTNMFALFLVPAAIVMVFVVIYCIVLPDIKITSRPSFEGWGAVLKTFWVSPLRYPDFAWAWLSRFMLFMAMFFFISFRFFYLEDQIGLDDGRAPGALATGVLIYTIALAIAAKSGGWVSDRMQRRKMFVFAAIVINAVAFAGLTFVDTVAGFYVIEAVMGLGMGVYLAVDNALNIEVLPDGDENAKNLGVMNIAQALPQSLAPLIGVLLLTLGTGGAESNYTALFLGAVVAGLLGALAILRVRSVR